MIGRRRYGSGGVRIAYACACMRACVRVHRPTISRSRYPLHRTGTHQWSFSEPFAPYPPNTCSAPPTTTAVCAHLGGGAADRGLYVGIHQCKVAEEPNQPQHRIQRGEVLVRGCYHRSSWKPQPHKLRTGFLSTLLLLVQPNCKCCCQHHRQASACVAPTVDRRRHIPRNSSTCVGVGAGASVRASGLYMMLGCSEQLQRQVYRPIGCKERLQLDAM